jgi:(hydroxyamino)benzene mutase
MAQKIISARQSRRLLQIGIGLILFSAFWGFVIPYARSQRIALSVHTLSGFQGVFVLAQGLLWRGLVLGPRALRVAFWCSVYGTFAILIAYVIAALWGVGLETIALMGELPHGLAFGTALQERIIKVIAYSSAPTGITAYTLILWGLRGVPDSGQTALVNRASQELERNNGHHGGDD